LDDLNSSIYWGMEVVIRRRGGGKREERGIELPFAEEGAMDEGIKKGRRKGDG
jgi:hypothetical protein